MEPHPRPPRLPAGIDDDGYRRIRRLMRASVLRTWRAGSDVIAGVDPWDVVDEAWISMAEQDFASKGEFLPHALTVARNKAIDHQRRAEARRRDRSIDLPALQEGMPGSAGADADYFRNREQVAAVFEAYGDDFFRSILSTEAFGPGTRSNFGARVLLDLRHA